MSESKVMGRPPRLSRAYEWELYLYRKSGVSIRDSCRGWQRGDGTSSEHERIGGSEMTGNNPRWLIGDDCETHELSVWVRLPQWATWLYMRVVRRYKGPLTFAPEAHK